MRLKFGMLLLVLGVFSIGCSSDPDVPKEMQEPIEVKGKISDDRAVGLDDDGRVVIEKSKDADDQLRVLEMNNERLKDDLDVEVRRLDRCRIDLAHPALGGSGKYKELPSVEELETDILDANELRINDNGELKMVGRRSFTEKYNAEVKRKRSLKSMYKTILNYRKDCEIDMSAARQKIGLPGARYESKGQFDSKGQWIKVHGAERNVDDAMKIKKQLDAQ
jgi:hypothetical protein